MILTRTILKLLHPRLSLPSTFLHYALYPSLPRQRLFFEFGSAVHYLHTSNISKIVTEPKNPITRSTLLAKYTTRVPCPIPAPFRTDLVINKCWIGKAFCATTVDLRAHFQNTGLMKMTPSSHVSLSVRQQPQSALVTLDGKEKSMSPTLPLPDRTSHLLFDSEETNRPSTNC